jgi:uncharacterized Ntn-hydrolase superfamily protein
MYKVFEYSHLGGSEILKVKFAEIDQQIDEVIDSIRDVRKLKVSKEKTKQGKRLFAPKDLNQRFRVALEGKGFAELIDRYTIEVPGHPYKVTGAYKQIDFSKDSVLVEVQFGMYSSQFAGIPL